MSEIEFLGALGVELLRHGELRSEHPDHELFQTSTVQRCSRARSTATSRSRRSSSTATSDSARSTASTVS